MPENYWLNLLAKAVYGIVLPCFLLHLALTSHFGLLLERQIQAWQQKMHDSLEDLANYHSDDRFFHGLLQANFADLERADKSREFIGSRINALKRRFSGLRFIVLDSAGNIVADLSDEKRYQYVMKAMNQTLREPDSVFKAGRIGLLRGYFGQFLMEKHLPDPLRNGYLGSCIRASEEHQKALLWFQVYRNFTLICFVDRNLLGLNLGPRLLVDAFNRRSGNMQLGFVAPGTRIVYGPASGSAEAGEIIIEAAAYARSATEFRTTARQLVLFRQVSPTLVIFSRLLRRPHLLDVEHEVNKLMYCAAKWLLVGAFVLLVMSLHSDRLFLSIRQKLMLLFLFANGLPIMILLATGYEFFEQKKSSLINAVHDQSSRIIKDFDSRYPIGRELMAARLNEFIAVQNLANGSRQWPVEEIEKLSETIDEFGPSEKYLFTGSGEQLLQHKRSGSRESDRFMRDFFSSALEFINNTSDTFVSGKKVIVEQLAGEDVYHSIISQLCRIEQQNYGSGLKWSYLNLLGDREIHSSWGIALAAWNPEGLQQAYINDQLDALNARIAPRRLYVMETRGEKIFPAVSEAGNLRRLMHRTRTRKLLTDDNLFLAGEEYVATVLKGIEMSEAVILALYPRKLISEQIGRLFWQIVMAAAISLLLVVMIVWFFSRRLLVPISGLAQGVRAISRQNFKHRVDFRSEDEFGQLISVFNKTIAGMAALAIGTAVQKSLLPSGELSIGKFSLYARSEFMSRMGGDYFDYFQPAPGRLGVFFGDVAGHGIPAALMMSMAKAVVVSAGSDFSGPAAMLQRANSVFLHLKEKGWKRMMTAQCLELDCDTGYFRFANAGQCFPLIVGADRKSFNYVKAFGMPLGNVLRKPYAEIEGRLEPGETLVLYTDGIIEATNAAGEVFDFSGFEKLLLASYNEDLATWWQDVFKGYSGWASAQDDDITLLMLKYEDKR